VKAARAEAPAETVTMLFTDIDGSSDSVRALGADRWESVLERHAEIIRKASDQRAGAAFDAAFREGSAAKFEHLEAMANGVLVRASSGE